MSEARAALGRLLGHPKWSWVLLGYSWAGRSGPWWLLGRPKWLRRGGKSCPRVAPGSPQSRSPPRTRTPFLSRTRVDPCIKCTRSKLDSGQVAAGLADSKDFVIVCWFDLGDLRAVPCLALPCLVLGLLSACLESASCVSCLALPAVARLVWISLALPCFGVACCLPSLGLLWFSLAA